MKTLTITVQTAEGLHVKPASQLFMAAREFSCCITAYCREGQADCKNILEILSLGAAEGERITLHFDGLDETEAKSAFLSLAEKSEEFSYE
ncbi:MAG: HPr family phosphocarrier protein [Clostridium sp.]|nr:HPr family phosphocarrier protein [Clostridium sp.]